MNAIAESAAAMAAPVRFAKIGAAGERLPADAPEWQAVLDSRTGLMWTVEQRRVPIWRKAAAAAESMRAAGFEDWRLPSADELLTLVDRTRFSPAIDAEYFPDCPSDWFWSSTPYAPSPGDCAWVVLFDSGSALWSFHGYLGFVRAVRAGQ